MAAVLASPALAISQTNGITYTDHQLESLVHKLTDLRNDIFAGSHPRLKLPLAVGDKGRPQSAAAIVTALPLPGLSNHTLKPVPPHGSPLPPLPLDSVHSKPQNGYFVSSQHQAAPATTASGINPIFLEKSDALVKAEAHVKRERLEHSLEDQAQQKKQSMRNKTHDEFAIPNFQVDDVLRSAHQLVKPTNIRREGPAVGGGSSTDSFDENTFYSSQMNESTSTEGEVTEEPKRPLRPKLCRFYLNDKPCPYGETCQFSHDPSMKARVDGSSLQTKGVDHSNVVEEASSRQHKSPQSSLKKGKESKDDHAGKEPTGQQQRIAQLEAELSAMKEKELQQSQQAQSLADASGLRDKSRHTAVGPDEFGRDISLRDQNPQQPNEVQHPYPRSTRENSRHRILTPPSANNVRVARNHITSPYAPQPARVSPLAVAKVSQVQQSQVESNRTSRIPYAEVVSDGSPNVSVQPLNSRKRRRVQEAGEQSRSVGPRREVSPQIRIKEEPVSPAPFNRPPSRRSAVQEGSQPVYADAHARPQERIMYVPRTIDRSGSVHEIEHIGPQSRRIISRNSQHYAVNNEPDLRRVVSERQMRVPISPMPRATVVGSRVPNIGPFQSSQFPEPEPRIVSASSQAYISPTGQRPLIQDRASVQSHPRAHDRSPSPSDRQMHSSPLGPPPMSMAPPHRRVMVDQYGNRFLEPEVRQESSAPFSRPPIHLEYDQYGSRVVERYTSVAPQSEPRYEHQPLRSQSVRRTFGDNESVPHQIRRQSSPASPIYVEYRRPVQVVEPRGEGPGGDSYRGQHPRTRIVYQEALPASSYEQSSDQREGTYRVQSVRPMEDHYEQTSRVQSVQPQPRIIQLTERQAASPHVTRQVSLRPDDGYAGPVNHGRGPQYQYASQGGYSGGYVQTGPDESFYDAPRVAQRM